MYAGLSILKNLWMVDRPRLGRGGLALNGGAEGGGAPIMGSPACLYVCMYVCMYYVCIYVCPCACACACVRVCVRVWCLDILGMCKGMCAPKSHRDRLIIPAEINSVRVQFFTFKSIDKFLNLIYPRSTSLDHTS